jgi:CheY-like chemotaxis protein
VLIGKQDMTILVVDDDEGHCELIRRNFRRAGIVRPVIVMHRGDDALDYVHKYARTAEAQGARGSGASSGAGILTRRPPSPGAERLLMLLDINMPGGMNGLDVLRHIKSGPTTRRIPVIMLTTTDDPREIRRSYDLGCNVYITKPIEAEAFKEAVTRLGQFVSIVSVASEQADPGP